MLDQFTVSQERGLDSVVEVYEEMKKSYPHDIRALVFRTGQSLTTNSERSYNVKEAIKKYCVKLGFRIVEINKNSIVAHYNARDHSHYVTHDLLASVKTDPRYQQAIESAKAERDRVNHKFGVAIRQLKNLIGALENQNELELKRLNSELISLQQTIVSELDIPDDIVTDPLDRKQLFEPSYPMVQMERNHYSNYNQGFDTLPPSDISEILALLDKTT